MEYEKYKKFIKKLEDKLIYYYNSIYSLSVTIQDNYESKNFKYNGIPMKSYLRVYHNYNSRATLNRNTGFHIPIDELNIRYTDWNKNKIYFRIDYWYRGESWEAYSIDKKTTSTLLDLISKYLTKDPGGDGISSCDVYLNYRSNKNKFNINTSYGNQDVNIGAVRDSGNLGKNFLVHFKVDYSRKEWVNYLKNNVISVTDDESTWDKSINDIINVINNINEKFSKYVQEIVTKGLNAFIDRLRDIIKNAEN